MFEYGTIYGILLLMMFGASIMDIVFIFVNVFFRREYRANFAKYGVSFFRIVFSILLIGYVIFVLTSGGDLTPTMRSIHLAAAILLGIDVAVSIVYKLYFYIRSKRFGVDPDKIENSSK
jgi:cation transporter-like permease